MPVSLHDLKKIVYWTLLALLFLYVISGFGILYSWIIEPITFGLLTKAFSYELHNYLLVPFVIVLLIHIFLVLRKKK
jgi:thiosulfate reductase cytochrome b subunit